MVIYGGIVWIMWLVMFIIRRCSKVIKKKMYKELVIDSETNEIYYADRNWDKWCKNEKIFFANAN